MLKKFTLLSLMLFIALIFTSACGSSGSGNCDFFGYPNTTTPETKTITLSKYKFTLDVGTNDKIIAYVNGIDKTNEVKYTPIKEEFTKDTVATVERGLITALKAGTEIFQVSYPEAESVTFTVTAIDPTLPTLEVVKNEINLEYGTDPRDIESIIVTLNGKDVTSEATFISTNENVATVDENGNINIVGEGETQIVIHVDGANDQVVTIKITLPELEINKNNINLQVGQTEQLTVKLKDEDKTQNAVYQSSDPTIATVDENGNITAVGEGTAIITIAVEGAKNAQVTVNVYDPENHKIKCHAGTNMYETEDGFVMYKGETGNITVLIGGVDKTAGGVYTPEDETIVKVDNENEHGKMYALELGTTSINLHHEEALEGDVKVNVIVKPKPTIQTDYMLIGNTQQIIFNGNAENWTFTSDDNNIATVDSAGKITSKGVNSTGTGSTIIHAYDGIKTHDFTINTYKTLDNNQNGVSSTLLIDEQRQQMLTILMDTGMISNENDIQDIVQIDDNGMSEIRITIDREDGQKVAVVVYKAGTVKYISTETVQNGQVTVNVSSSPQNTIAQDNENGEIERVENGGFYDDNNNLLVPWDQAVDEWGWRPDKDYRTDYNNGDGSWMYKPSWHMYKLSQSHPILLTATKLVIPDKVNNIGEDIFWDCNMQLKTIVISNNTRPYEWTNFGGCLILGDNYESKISNLTIRSDHPDYVSVNGVIYTRDMKTLVYCPPQKTKLKIPESVTVLYNYAFSNNNANSFGDYNDNTDIQCPNTIEDISGACFDASRMTIIKLPASVKTISPAFSYMHNAKIFIPKNVETVKPSWWAPDRFWCGISFWSTNIQFYCEATSQPSGWESYWDCTWYNRGYSWATVYWGQSRNSF